MISCWHLISHWRQEQDPHPDPKCKDPRIRIRTKISPDQEHWTNYITWLVAANRADSQRAARQQRDFRRLLACRAVADPPGLARGNSAPPASACCSAYTRNRLECRGFHSQLITVRYRCGIRINLSCWIRIRILIQIADPDPDPGGQKLPTKIENSTESSCFEVLDVLFWGLKWRLLL